MRNKKLISLIGIVPFIVGCADKIGELKSIPSLLETTIVRGLTHEDYKSSKNTANKMYYYSVNKNGKVARLKFETEKNEDNRAFNTSNTFFSNFSSNCIGVSVHDGGHQDQYLVTKLGGFAYHIEDSSVDIRLDGAKFYSDYRNNFYGICRAKLHENIDYEDLGKVTLARYSLAKLSINDDKKVDVTEMYDGLHVGPSSEFIADSYGNVILVDEMTEDNLKIKCFTYDSMKFELTSKEVRTYSTNNGTELHKYPSKMFWLGLDSEIYTNEGGYICKIKINKDNNGISKSVEEVRVCLIDDYDKLSFSSNKIIEMKDIYFVNQTENSVDFYALSGEHAGRQIISVPIEETTYSINVHTAKDIAYFVTGNKLYKVTFGVNPTSKVVPFDYFYRIADNSCWGHDSFIFSAVDDKDFRNVYSYDLSTDKVKVLAGSSEFEIIDSIAYTFDTLG